MHLQQFVKLQESKSRITEVGCSRGAAKEHFIIVFGTEAEAEGRTVENETSKNYKPKLWHANGILKH